MYWIIGIALFVTFMVLTIMFVHGATRKKTPRKPLTQDIMDNIIDNNFGRKN